LFWGRGTWGLSVKAESVWEQVAEEDIWVSRGWGNRRRLKKIA
jgi:hypothetical protein